MSERRIPPRQAAIEAMQRRFGFTGPEPAPDLMEMLCLFAECLENVMNRLEVLEAGDDTKQPADQGERGQGYWLERER